MFGHSTSKIWLKQRVQLVHNISYSPRGYALFQPTSSSITNSDLPPLLLLPTANNHVLFNHFDQCYVEDSIKVVSSSSIIRFDTIAITQLEIRIIRSHKHTTSIKTQDSRSTLCVNHSPQYASVVTQWMFNHMSTAPYTIRAQRDVGRRIGSNSWIWQKSSARHVKLVSTPVLQWYHADGLDGSSGIFFVRSHPNSGLATRANEFRNTQRTNLPRKHRKCIVGDTQYRKHT